MSKKSEFPIVDWAEALSQVGGDKEFLKEVFDDLFTEADAAVDEFVVAIDKKELEDVKKVAHRIKGSASYLGSHRLRELCAKLQDYCINQKEIGVTTFPADHVAEQFAKYKEELASLKQTVAEDFPK